MNIRLKASWLAQIALLGIQIICIMLKKLSFTYHF